MVNVLFVLPLLAVYQISSAHPLNWKESSRVSQTHPIVRQKSLPVDEKYFSSFELKQFTESLAKEMFSNFGILGIAAPQMGVGVRIFLLRASVLNPFNRSYDVFINPVITPIGEARYSRIEFCLTASGFHRMRRFKKIRLEYSKLDGTRDAIELTGSKARIAQHEFDHLEGKLISDD